MSYIVTKLHGLANRGFALIEGDGWWRKRGYFSSSQVRYEGNREADKPCVTVEAPERWRNFGCIDNFDLDQEARQAGERSREQRNQRDDAETVGKAVLTFRIVKRGEI